MIRLLPIAVRNLRRNVRRTLFTFGAIAVGCSMLLFIDAVNRGVIRMLMDSVVEARIGGLQVHKRGYVDNAKAGKLLHLNFAWDEALKAKIEAVPGVVAATGRIVHFAQLASGSSLANVSVIAIDPAGELVVCPNLAKQLGPDSTPLSPDGPDKILMTQELANSLVEGGAGPAHGLDVMNLIATGPAGRHNSLDVGLQGYVINLLPGPMPRRQIYAPLALAQDLLGMEGLVTEVAVRIADYDQLDELRANLQATLGDEYEVHDWRDIAPEIADLSDRQKVILGVVSMLLLAVVVFGISNTMLMCVRERVREIGTMTAIGTRPGQVLAIFSSEAALLGLLGGLGGALLGLLLSYFFLVVGIPLPGDSPLFAAGIRPLVDPLYAGELVFGAMVVAWLAGLFPAWRAALLNPVEALATL
jgi:putative ABC transport system permease protein